MNKSEAILSWRPALGAAACFALVGAVSSFGQTGDSADEVFDLSPFEVQSNDNQGYRATSSLLGGRTAMSMEDIANSVDVITKDLMEDLAITDIQDMAAIANNVQPADIGFANADGQEREVWNYNYLTIRGFKVGTATRNFMNLETSVEAYNAQSVDFSKGPNAVLFGLGDPGGTYNYSTKTPFFVDETTVEYKLGSEGGHRGTFDMNKVIVEDTLAIRVNGLKQDWEYYHKPGYTKTDAMHVSLRWKPTENTTLTLAHEYNATDRAYPKKFFGQDRVTQWLAAGSPEVVDFAISPTDPRNPNGIPAGDAILLEGSDVAVHEGEANVRILGPVYMVTNRESATHTRYLQVNPTQVHGMNVTDPATYANFDYPINYNAQGPNGLSDTRFNITEFNLQHKIAENFYVDLSMGKSGQQKLSTHTVSSNIWAEPRSGEHFGEFYTATSRPMQLRRDWDIEDIRLSASYDFDFGDSAPYLGTHRLAFMTEKNKKTEVWDQWRLVTTGTPEGRLSSNNFTAAAYRPMFVEYFDSSEGELYSADWRDTYWAKETMSIDGYTFEWLKPDTWANKRQRQELDTKLYVLQSRFWNDRVVTSIGYRDESREDFLADGVVGDRSNPYTMVVPAYGFMDGAPEGDISFRYAKLPSEITGYNSGISRNHGVVFHATDWISLSYSKANSVGLPSESEDIYGDLLGATQGVTEEFGIRFNLFERRVYLSLNKYETTAEQTQQFSNFINDARDIETILFANSEITGVTENILENTGAHSRSDEVAEGIELIVNGSFGNGWSFRLSGSQNETLIKEAGTDMVNFFEQRRSLYATPSYANLTTPQGTKTLGTALSEAEYEIAKILALQGNQKFPSSEYRINGIVKYSVQNDNFFKGVSVGTNFDWASAPIVGYFEDADGNFDVSRPAKGSEIFRVNLFANYSRPLNDKVDWKIQLNVDNLFDENDPYVIEKRSVGTDPDDFGWMNYAWRPVDGLTWTLSNSFTF